jgi:ADP-dependent NAD(P)H-hydrate dehydratase
MSGDTSPLPAPPLPRLKPRRLESHKGDFGRCILIGGSRRMSGAIGLAGLAALRSGAGLVQLAVPDACLDVVAGFEPSYMTVPLPCDDDGRIGRAAREVIAELAQAATCLACGPGLGRPHELSEFVGWLYRTVDRPVVFDADGLNALAAEPGQLTAPGGPRILTPHPGEFRRLIGDSQGHLPPPVLRDRAVELARHTGAVVVFKGHRTLVTDGQQVVINTTGNPGMATGGSGDVLTGVVTALLGQGMTPFEAAHLGVYMHGLAGDLAAEQLGQVSLIASDLVRFLPAAFQRVATEGS